MSEMDATYLTDAFIVLLFEREYIDSSLFSFFDFLECPDLFLLEQCNSIS